MIKAHGDDEDALDEVALLADVERDEVRQIFLCAKTGARRCALLRHLLPMPVDLDEGTCTLCGYSVVGRMALRCESCSFIGCYSCRFEDNEDSTADVQEIREALRGASNTSAYGVNTKRKKAKPERERAEATSGDV